MIDLPQGFRFHGVYCYPSPDDPAGFFYIPGEPTPERGPSGQPTLILWLSDRGALLQLGTQWAVDGDTLEALRQQISRRFSERRLSPGSIKLMPAPAGVESVTVELDDGSGHLAPLQSQSSSGFPPFSAVFNLTLSAEQKARAASAVNGQAGLLRVTYHASLTVAVAVSATIAGDVRRDVGDLGRDATLDDARKQLTQALEDGRLRLTRSHPEDTPAELVAQVDDLVREKGAALLLDMARQTPVSAAVDANFTVTATRATTRAVPLDSATDLASWFPAGSGAAHMRVIGSDLPGEGDTAGSSPATVSLGFDLGDAPIGFIELRRGGTGAALQGPNFQPVTLSSASGPLSVKTHYTDGAAYETQVAAPDSGTEWALKPADLGLAQVTVDGTARQAAGADEVRLHIAYHPVGGGSEDDRHVHLNDRGWTRSWFVVSRSAGLAGSLEYDWREVLRDGSQIKHASTTVDTPQVKL